MLPRVVIYGVKQQAQQLYSYIQQDACAEVVGFVVDKEYKASEILLDLPIYAFEELAEVVAPTDVEIAVSFAYQHMVQDRQQKIEKCKQAGFRMFTFLSKSAAVYSEEIGAGCIVYPGCTLAHGTKIGEGNFFEVGTSIAHNTTIGDYNFFAPGVTVCGSVKIEHNCFFGANCTVLDSAHIAPFSLVSAGAVVRDTQADGVFFPARTVRWHGSSREIKI